MTAMTAVLPDGILPEHDRNESFCDLRATSPTLSEKDRSERYAAEERKRLHPFFSLSHRTHQSSNETTISCSSPQLSASAEGNKNGKTARRKSRADPVESAKPRPKKRKSEGNRELDTLTESLIDSTVRLPNELYPHEAEAMSTLGSNLIDNSAQSPDVVVYLDCAEEGNAPVGSEQPDHHTHEGELHEFDTNESRRKRQKTASPEAIKSSARSEQHLATSTGAGSSPTRDIYSSFYLQLEAAAQGDLSAFDKEGVWVHASSPISQSEPSLPPPLEHPSTPSKQVIEISSDPIISDSGRRLWNIQDRHCVPLSSPLPKQAPMTKSENTILVEPPQQDPPRKKQLRINAKGKFSSPISQKSTQPSKIAKGRTSSRARNPKRQKLAILKYSTGDDTASALSTRIEEILSSPPRPYSTRPFGSPETDEKLLLPPPPQMTLTNLAGPLKREARPALPPKPTHPFFKGKLGHPVNLKVDRQTLSTGEAVTSCSDTDRRVSLSPAKGTAENAVTNSARSSGFARFRKLGSSPSKSRFVKVIGALEPAWPSNGTAHVRGLEESDGRHQVVTLASATPASDTNKARRGERKLKSAMVQVPKHEDVICCMSSRLNIAAEQQSESSPPNFSDEQFRPPKSLRLPERVLTTGREIQKFVRAEVKCRLPPAGYTGYNGSDDEYGDSPAPLTDGKPHTALLSLYQSILKYSGPFDRAECETQSWIQKYAPQSAAEVLQSGREAIILRDWLLRLQVVSVDTGGTDGLKARNTRGSAKRLATVNNAKLNKKRKKRNDDLQGFVISSEEEDNEMEEITDPEDDDLFNAKGPSTKKSAVRAGASTGKLTNAVLISGPNGCGKTAAVYAVAKELGFEVFEVNAGSRRSGKDILERVGDMTRNHLVHRQNEDQKETSGDDDLLRVTEALKRDLDSGKQSKMKSFFKGKDRLMTNLPLKKRSSDDEIPEKLTQPQQQKQSLILLEEVDILYEEDKPFWSTVTALIAQSKRPVIMTCNDESLLPLDTLSFHAELRFTPPPEDLAVDYLLLLAAKEGHFIQREALSGLYKAKHRDLRGSIMEIDYWCQIGVGDRKGGLEWIIQRWPPGKDVDNHGDSLRVASKNTYLTGMGWLGREACQPFDEMCSDDEEEILMEAWDGWQIDMEDWHDRDDIQEWAAETASIGRRSSPSRSISLNAYELFLDSISAADVYAGQGMRTGNQIVRDPSQPSITDKLRCDDIQGRQFLRAEPLPNYGRLQSQMSAYTKCLAKRVLRTETLDLNTESQIESLYEQDMVQTIIKLEESSRRHHHLDHTELSAPFSLIAASSTALLSPQPTRTISSFDRTSALIATDLAPYVRTLVTRDIRFEEERQKARRLFLQGGRNGKKPRTTRSAWSALDGLSRASKNTNKWIDRNINHSLILRTGGKEWQETAAEEGIRAEDGTADDDRGSKASLTSECESMDDSEN